LHEPDPARPDDRGPRKAGRKRAGTKSRGAEQVRVQDVPVSLRVQLAQRAVQRGRDAETGGGRLVREPHHEHSTGSDRHEDFRGVVYGLWADTQRRRVLGTCLRYADDTVREDHVKNQPSADIPRAVRLGAPGTDNDRQSRTSGVD